MKKYFIKIILIFLLFFAALAASVFIGSVNIPLEKLLTPEHRTDGIPSFRNLRDAYIFFTGDSDIDGVFKPLQVSPGLRACMDFSSASFTYALQNALRMYISRSYKAFPYHEEKLISEKDLEKYLK